MEQITINPNNEPYYSDEFIRGFECGTQRQLEADKADRPQDDDWEKYSDKLWKNAYERGKADRPQGEWIPSDTDGFVCSVCKNGYRNQPTLMGRPMFEYCPVCGARMKGADDE